MPFTLRHDLVSEMLQVDTHETPQGTYFTVVAQGSFWLLYPGRLQKIVSATVRHSMRFDNPIPPTPQPPPGIDGLPTGPHHPMPPPMPQPLHNGVQVTEEPIPLQFKIYDPDGREFTKDEVTLADLRKYRDLRGSPRGRWSYTLSGVSRVYVLLDAINETVTDPKGIIDLSLLETVPSSSAGPLVSRTKLDAGRSEFKFDLYRVGTFVATVSFPLGLGTWDGSMRLLDPDGAEFAASTSRHLRCDIPLAALGRSRDPSGQPRLWTLEVASQGGVVIGQPYVSALVLGSGRIGTAVLYDRIQDLLGPHGSFIDLVGENSGGKAKAVLTIKDIVAAETIDMHGLLDSRLKKEHQSTDIQANTPMVLFSDDETMAYALRINVGSVKLKSIDIEIGPGQGLGADTPVIRLDVATEGEVKVDVDVLDLTVATARLRDDHLAVEVGIRVDPDGTPRVVSWVRDDPLDIDPDWTSLAALVLALTATGGILGGLAGAIGGLLGGGITADAIVEYIEHELNEKVHDGAVDLFDDPALAPTILMTLFGTHLTYVPVRFEGEDILFEHVAPLEPDPKPRPNYAGAIGRTLLLEAVGHVGFQPMTLGDTWAADNLKSKIDHIVVVMMENRSYNHVLGYRALPPISDGADGLTAGLISVIQGSGEGHVVRPLRNAGFDPNVLGFRTRLPKGVGHELEDVTQQLSGIMDGPAGRRINDPKGFVDNFREKKLHGHPEGEDGVIPDDVLGYYEKREADQANDLPIYAFLAENYAYCDRYFCSHPGPTLPNRMYSLCGDVQYDRLGVPILDNNHGDNFLLSRAETIYDLLTKEGVSWRVYESNPSVTMLRMFARYATDNVNIRPLSDLAGHVAAGDMAALTVIEPAMHHHPQNDDHPDADMYRGQAFIKGVYDTLRSNEQLWGKTLLIITYDEHGGFYDHVIPPVADVLNSPEPSLVSGEPFLTSDGGDGGDGGSAPSGGVGGGRLSALHIRAEILEAVLSDSPPVSTTPADATIQVHYGVRVPTFAVSPWVAPGKGPTMVLDHCSILKTILARFCGERKPFLSDRVHASQSFEAYLTEAQPRMGVSQSPQIAELPIDVRRMMSETSQIVTPPLTRRRMREEQVDFHDISGRLARMLGR